MSKQTYHGVILDRDSFDRGDLDMTGLEQGPVHWTSHNHTSHGETSTRTSTAEIVITNKVVIGREVIDASPNLKLILAAATGTDNIDVTYCREKGIVVCNARNYSTPAVVQHTIALMLNLLTSQHRYLQDVREGLWSKSKVFCLIDHPIVETAGKTVGIIGYGAMGKRVAEVAAALGMEVLVCQRPGGKPVEGRVPLEQLLTRSDVVSIHCPLTDDTRGLIGEAEFQLMKNRAVIINTARGAIIDIDALAKALDQGEIAGAGIDVFDGEPPSHDNVLLQLDNPNLIITPHNAWATRESRQRLVDIIGDNIRAWTEGSPTNAVT